MADDTWAWPTPFHMAGEAFGVRVLIRSDSAEVIRRLRELLPPGWVRLEPTEVLEDEEVPVFTIYSEDGIEYVLTRGEEVLARSQLDIVLGVFDAQLRNYIAIHSPSRVFVHAGVVGHRGRAIVIPGRSFSGKTTLVAELVRTGAEYYSDEFAVLDDQGLIHPYPKPLSIRGPDLWATDHPVASLGGRAGTDPLRLGLIVVTQYRVDAQWEPRELSPGEAVLAMLANTVPAQDRPEETMVALRQVVNGSSAVALESDRGDAATVAPRLLELVPH